MPSVMRMDVLGFPGMMRADGALTAPPPTLPDNVRKHAMGKRNVPEIGERFNRWTVLADLGTRGRAGTFVRARCECGSKRDVLYFYVRTGRSQSCGCFSQEVTRERTTTHGMSKSTPEFDVWHAMLERCRNPNLQSWSDYGGRSISVCKRWGEFALFFQDMGPRPSPKHSLDRIDNEGNYEPGNCRWATSREQNGNTRKNRWIEHDGRRMILADWAREIGISSPGLIKRLRRWSVEHALTEKTQSGKTQVGEVRWQLA